MSRDVDNALLNYHKFGDSEWFEANSSGISQLKLITRQDANEFLYLRKAADFGAVMQMLFELISQSPDTIHTVYSAYLSQIPELGITVSADDMINLNWEKILAFYLILTKGKELTITTAKALKSFWTRVRKGKSTPRIPDLRIICYPDEINEMARVGWESMGFKIRHYIDPKQAGSHRFYLSEKSYCFFIRKPDSTFFGFRGSDIGVIRQLKAQFQNEWQEQYSKVPPKHKQ